MKVLRIFKKIPKARLVSLAIIIFLILAGLALFVWGIRTGRIKPNAQSFCPAGQVCNTATITYDGLSVPIESNMVSVEIVDTPIAPSNLSAAATSSSAIHLSWTDNASNETGFKIERSLSQSSGFSEISAASIPDQTSYDDQGLTANTTYYYRIRAYNAAGDSDYSNTAQAKTQSGGQDTTFNITLSLQGRPVSSPDYSASNISLKVYPTGNSALTDPPLVEKTDISTDAAGHGQTILTGLSAGSIDVRIKVPSYLSSLQTNKVLNPTLNLDFGEQRVGDIAKDDNQVNMFDYNRIILAWRTKEGDTKYDPLADVQKNGQVNMFDITMLLTNWRQKGQ